MRLSPHLIRALSPQLVAKLRSVMIRHTKAQRLANGQQMLALPTLECSTVWLDMSPRDVSRYKQERLRDAGTSWGRSSGRLGAKSQWTVETRLKNSMLAQNVGRRP